MTVMDVILNAAEPPNPKDAVKWLYQAAAAGYVRAQYQLGLCLHHAHGVAGGLPEAVCSALTIPIYS